MDPLPEPYLFIVLSFFRAFDVAIIPAVLTIIFLLICSSLFSASEVAFFSLKTDQLQKLREQKNSRTGQIIVNLLHNPSKLIATVLISNTMVNIAIILVSSYLLDIIFDFTTNRLLGTIIEVGVVTFTIIMFGEVLPKVYATRASLSLAHRMAIPIYIVNKILSPISYAMTAATHAMEKNIKTRSYDVSIEELNHAIDIASDHSTPAEEKQILKGIVKFGNTDITQIMRQRPDVVAFEIDMPYTKLLAKIIENGYSRVPVFEDSIDNIKGILHIKDLLAHLDEKDNYDWKTLLRPAFIVPESKKINDLLEDFQERKTHFAIIIDEYGGMMGIVTLEDVLEEIVGELNDEFDVEEPFYTKLDENTFVFEAKTMLNDISRIMGIDMQLLRDVEGEAVSLAGLILEIAGKIPQKNDIINHGNLTFTIEAADRRKIKRVKISRKV